LHRRLTRKISNNVPTDAICQFQRAVAGSSTAVRVAAAWRSSGERVFIRRLGLRQVRIAALGAHLDNL
jgi:hypothetical protein